MRPAHPHERRFQRFGYAALAALTLLAATVLLQGEPGAFGVELGLLPLGLVLVALVAGALAVHRRSALLALATAVLMALAVAPVATPSPGLGGYAMGVLFGALLLAFGELVHLTTRYDRAHAAVEKEGVPEDHLDRVSDEALKTLATRALLAGLFAFAGVLLAFLLALAGPLRLREAVETTAPLGVALASLVLMAGTGFYVLARGGPRREDPAPPLESVPDATPPR